MIRTALSMVKGSHSKFRLHNNLVLVTGNRNTQVEIKPDTTKWW